MKQEDQIMKANIATEGGALAFLDKCLWPGENLLQREEIKKHILKRIHEEINAFRELTLRDPKCIFLPMQTKTAFMDALRGGFNTRLSKKDVKKNQRLIVMGMEIYYYDGEKIKVGF